MRFLLSGFAILALFVHCASVSVAQGWQPSGLDLGVPKPQAPRPAPMLPDPQTRTRAYNQAATDEISRYNAQQAGLKAVQPDIDLFQRQLQEQAQFNVAFEARNKPIYEAAYQALAGMLDGRRKFSLPLAVFIVENTYADNTLNYPVFRAQLEELADMCRKLAANDTRPVARFMALHRLMTDTVHISLDGKAVSKHLPYRYDLEDFRGEQDYTK